MIMKKKKLKKKMKLKEEFVDSGGEEEDTILNEYFKIVMIWKLWVIVYQLYQVFY